MARIMVVDDAMFMRVGLKNILQANGHEVVAEAENGEDAVAKFKETKPDLVTMDITMPQMDGIAACKAIKQFDPNAAIVMVTTMGQKHMVLQAIEAGARDFIVKPFQPERVLEGVRKIVGE